MSVLYEGIRRLIEMAYGMSGDYGIAILLITVAVRLCLTPLGRKQRQAMKSQQELGLRVEEIRKKYRHNKAKMDAELEKLYRREGVQSLGCMLTFLQLPIMLALYRGIGLAVTADATSILLPWAPSLLLRDNSFILPALTVLVWMFPQIMPYLGFFKSLGLPKAGAPRILIMFCMNSWFACMLPAGVGLYYMVSGLFTCVEQTVEYAGEMRKLA